MQKSQTHQHVIGMCFVWCLIVSFVMLKKLLWLWMISNSTRINIVASYLCDRSTGEDRLVNNKLTRGSSYRRMLSWWWWSRAKQGLRSGNKIRWCNKLVCFQWFPYQATRDNKTIWKIETVEILFFSSVLIVLLFTFFSCSYFTILGARKRLPTVPERMITTCDNGP